MSKNVNMEGVRFLHFRSINTRASTAGEVREVNARGGMTVAYRIDGNTIVYAGARCHHRDNFVKAQGRIKAAGRLASTNYQYTFTGSERDFVTFISDAAAGLELERKFNSNRKAKLAKA